MVTRPGRRAASTSPAYLAFAAFGSLWGTWGGALPQIRDQAGVTDGQLGTALLFVGAGALPAMLLAGRAADRFGRRVPAAALLGLGLAGLLVAATARGPVSLSVGLAVLGAASGAVDVGINTVAVDLERATGRPVITRSHGTFSAAVVVSSLIAGMLTALDAPSTTVFGLVAAVSLTASARLLAGRRARVPGEPQAARPDPGPGVHPSPRRGVLIAVGLVAALALAVENAHQSWGAVYLGDVLAVPSGLTAIAPALFAGVVAVTRFAVGARPHLPAVPLLLTGGLVTVTGTVLLARAQSTGAASFGLALAAAGTAVLFPTLLRAGVGHVHEAARGRATAAVSTTAYLGFLLGPVYVGQIAGTVDLRAAMLGVAALAALFSIAAGLLLPAAAPAHASQTPAGGSDPDATLARWGAADSGRASPKHHLRHPPRAPQHRDSAFGDGLASDRAPATAPAARTAPTHPKER
jgi:MFS family permease